MRLRDCRRPEPPEDPVFASAALPKTSVEVDGSKAFVNLEISVRWPASVPEITEQVRRHVHERVRELTGLDVVEVHIVVADLAIDIAPPPRVR